MFRGEDAENAEVFDAAGVARVAEALRAFAGEGAVDARAGAVGAEADFAEERRGGLRQEGQDDRLERAGRGVGGIHEEDGEGKATGNRDSRRTEARGRPAVFGPRVAAEGGIETGLFGPAPGGIDGKRAESARMRREIDGGARGDGMAGRVAAFAAGHGSAAGKLFSFRVTCTILRHRSGKSKKNHAR